MRSGRSIERASSSPWFEARGTISGGAVEGMNNKLKVIRDQ